MAVGSNPTRGALLRSLTRGIWVRVPGAEFGLSTEVGCLNSIGSGDTQMIEAQYRLQGETLDVFGKKVLDDMKQKPGT